MSPSVPRVRDCRCMNAAVGDRLRVAMKFAEEVKAQRQRGQQVGPVPAGVQSLMRLWVCESILGRPADGGREKFARLRARPSRRAGCCGEWARLTRLSGGHPSAGAAGPATRLAASARRLNSLTSAREVRDRHQRRSDVGRPDQHQRAGCRHPPGLSVGNLSARPTLNWHYRSLSADADDERQRLGRRSPRPRLVCHDLPLGL